MTVPSGLYVIDGGILLVTALTSTGYSARDGDLPGGYTATCITSDRGDSDKMYAVVNGNIYRSANAGVNWTLIKSFSHATNSLAANWTVPGEVWAAVSGAYGSTGDGGIWKSTDYGDTWTRKLFTYDALYVSYNPGLFISAAGDQVLVTMKDALYERLVARSSSDGGDTWATIAPTASDVRTPGQSVAMDNPDKSALWCSSLTAAGGPWVTADNWSTNTDLSGTLGAGAPVHYDRAGSYMLKLSGEVERSTDGGSSWSTRATDGNIMGLTPGHISLTDNGASVFVAGLDGYLFYSADSGVTWGNVRLDREASINWVHLATEITTAPPPSLAFKLVIS
jgi:hypothetical protein